MDNIKDPLSQIAEIRKMMAESGRFISLSGLSGVFAGFYALIGVAAFYFYMQKELSIGYSELAHRSPVDISINFYTFCFLDAFLVLSASLITGVFFTTRNARKNNQKVWSSATQKLLINLAIPLVSGGIFCLSLIYHNLPAWAAPASLIFYGLALINASKYTLEDVKYLGLTELILGLLACWFIGFGLTFWAIGFGICHIIYGLFMYVKYEAKPKNKSFQ